MTDTKIVLVGAMGAGKSTVGRALAEVLGWPLRDNDLDLKERAGRTGAAIAAQDGVAALHELESQVLLDALAAPGDAVVTAAGSVVERDLCRAAMERSLLVWLDLPAEQLAARRLAGAHRRPIDDAEAAALAERRSLWLHALADVRIAESLPVDRVVEMVLTALRPDLRGR